MSYITIRTMNKNIVLRSFRDNKKREIQKYNIYSRVEIIKNRLKKKLLNIIIYDDNNIII